MISDDDEEEADNDDDHVTRQYLDLLERVWHHGDEHIDKDDDGHRVVAHEHVLADTLREGLYVTLADRVELRQTEQRPEQGHVAFPDTDRQRACTTVHIGKTNYFRPSAFAENTWRVACVLLFAMSEFVLFSCWWKSSKLLRTTNG